MIYLPDWLLTVTEWSIQNVTNPISRYEAVGFFLLVDVLAFSAANTMGLYAIFLVILKGESNIKTSIYKGLYDGYTFSYFER